MLKPSPTAAFLWRSYASLLVEHDPTALLPRCRCAPTGFSWRPFRLPWERPATARTLCMLKVWAMAWRPMRPQGVQWRCHGDGTAIPWRSRRFHCTHLGVLSFSCTPRWRHPGVTGALHLSSTNLSTSCYDEIPLYWKIYNKIYSYKVCHSYHSNYFSIVYPMKYKHFLWLYNGFTRSIWFIHPYS